MHTKRKKSCKSSPANSLLLFGREVAGYESYSVILLCGSIRTGGLLHSGEGGGSAGWPPDYRAILPICGGRWKSVEGRSIIFRQAGRSGNYHRNKTHRPESHCPSGYRPKLCVPSFIAFLTSTLIHGTYTISYLPRSENRLAMIRNIITHEKEKEKKLPDTRDGIFLLII